MANEKQIVDSWNAVFLYTNPTSVYYKEHLFCHLI